MEYFFKCIFTRHINKLKQVGGGVKVVIFLWHLQFEQKIDILKIKPPNSRDKGPKTSGERYKGQNIKSGFKKSKNRTILKIQ